MRLLKIYLAILLFFTTSNFVSQTNLYGIIEYESKINGKKLDEYLSKKRSEIKNNYVVKSLDKVFFYTKAIKSKLVFTHRKGLFTVKDKLSFDIQDLGQRINHTSAGGTKEYFYDDNNKIYLIKECDAVGECFIFPNNFLKWQLTQETKNINGYISYKATRSNGKVIAWYTPKIPISFGPKGEYGLPGLILELAIGKIIFKAKKIVLNPKEKIIVEELKGGEFVTFEEYKKIIAKAKEKVFGN